MSGFSEQAGRDSRSIKALTLVATFYLPASFIAVRIALPTNSILVVADETDTRQCSTQTWSR